MTRVAAEREMNTSSSHSLAYDIARTVEVYQARTAHPLSHSLRALTAYTVARLPRCGASHDDIKRQGVDILALLSASTRFTDVVNGT
jgi:hypothetical protein